MNAKKTFIGVLSFFLFLNGSFAANSSTSDDVAGLVKFLLSDGETVKSKQGLIVPLSYYTGDKEDIAKYFGDYICKQTNTCQVVDTVYDNPFAILGEGLPPKLGTEQDVLSAQSQLERIDMKHGADIYDAATWQIALALAAQKGYFDSKKAAKLVNNQLLRLQEKDNKATSKVFKYGYSQSISDPHKAFTFRMLANDFVLKDSFYNTRYQDGVSWDYSPDELAENDLEHGAAYFKYVSTWSDWKPILGENAWAQLIAPIQAELLLNHNKLTSDSKGLQNAISVLYAFSAMQSAVGGIYYAPGGSLGNMGSIARGEISLENNFSALGGLQILKRTLENTEQTSEIKKALSGVNVLLYGGQTVNGFETIGLISFLYNGGFDKEKGVFYTHGVAKDPRSQKAWHPDNSGNANAMAVDVNTWGIAALGPETIDRWYGNNTALHIWQQVREQGGYFDKNGKLLGVGYTLSNKDERIMSTEWTAGAVNALNMLIAYYDKKAVDTSALKDDREAMKAGIKRLRNDHYLGQGFDNETPSASYVSVPPSEGLAYLYASKRFAIPFGWYANTLPSTTSNAWVIMNVFDYNPFQYLGALTGENYKMPEKMDISGDNEGVLPRDVTIMFDAGDLGPIQKLSVNYKLLGSSRYLTAKESNGRLGNAVLPKDTAAISMAYYKDNWYGVCKLEPATLLCSDEACHNTRRISARWSADGEADCELSRADEKH